MINKFFEFNSEKTICYYSLDWDDNILNMPTVIHMEHLINGEWIPEDVSTANFAKVRTDSDNWRLLNNNPEQAFSEFRDNGPRGKSAFLDDMKSAISKGSFGPAWDDFVECLVNGSLFAIITARGHESESIRLGIEWIIDNILSEEQLYEMYNNLLKFAYLFNDKGEYDKILKGQPTNNELVKLYLDNCEYVGVSAPSRGGSPSNPEKAKEDALMEFIEKVNKFAESIGYKARIGFSDDDLKNVKHIEDLMDSIHHERFSSLISFVVKGTKDPENITKKVRVFEGILNFSKFCESQDPLQTSTISMRLPNASMSGDMDSKEPFEKQRKNQLRVLSKISKESLKNIKK